MNFIELGKAIGWLGGTMYLGAYVEQRIQSWRFARAMRAMQAAKDASPGPVPLRFVNAPNGDGESPRLHTFVCTQCQKPVTSIFGCTHEDAPKLARKFPVLPADPRS